MCVRGGEMERGGRRKEWEIYRDRDGLSVGGCAVW